jgi:hypothetical protein
MYIQSFILIDKIFLLLVRGKRPEIDDSIARLYLGLEFFKTQSQFLKANKITSLLIPPKNQTCLREKLEKTKTSGIFLPRIYCSQVY